MEKKKWILAVSVLWVFCLSASVWAGTERLMGAEAIREGQGWLVALTGIITVFVALVVITLIISALPGILRVLARFYPEQEDAPSPAKKSSDTAQVAAAIAVAYHQKNS